ncbi:hypothetical protein Ahy_A02g006756 [Arachis hypogaea]|uniref:Uncharacterized protein n=1 Tax=Arachis hypogaea TaxID=3818 RepID=A0A445EAT7_ARAHY|nr:hypothetical protein Ahy_A02g006756 [Arachis hypogaea]
MYAALKLRGDGFDVTTSSTEVHRLTYNVYNDERVDEKFDIKAWVCVSDQFDIVKVTKTLIEAAGGSSYNGNALDLLQTELKDKLMRKKFLIVLDDVWIDNSYSRQWKTLQKPFQFGKEGSKVLVTTRNDTTADVVKTVPAYKLRLLSDTDYNNGVKELGALANIHESLHIHQLENILDGAQALEARIADKKHLKGLYLTWSYSHSYIDDSQDILNNLKPHRNLRKLSINEYKDFANPVRLHGTPPCIASLVKKMMKSTMGNSRQSLSSQVGNEGAEDFG